MIDPDELSDPVVGAFVAGINAGDRQAFFALLTPDATMSDDGTERNLAEWVEREIFAPNGHMTVDSESDGGRSLMARFSNSPWGEMRTIWRFEVRDGQIARFETGQA